MIVDINSEIGIDSGYNSGITCGYGGARSYDVHALSALFIGSNKPPVREVCVLLVLDELSIGVGFVVPLLVTSSSHVWSKIYCIAENS